MDSIRQLSRYLGHRDHVSIRHDLFGQNAAVLGHQISLRNYVRATKGLVVKDPIDMIKDLFKNQNSEFWNDFKIKLKEAIKEKARERGEELEITRIILEDPWVFDPFADSEEFWSALCDHNHISIVGGITFGIEGVVSWPLPDPDLVFTWELELKAIDSFSTILISGTITFERVDGPGLGWIFAVIGSWLGGGAFYLSGLVGAGTGLAIGEILDSQYENRENQAKALKAINSGYDAFEDFFNEFVESRIVKVSRPNDKSIRITLEINHVPTAAEGLHGIACGIRDIIEWLS